jgi:hypothetical protein
MTIRSGIIVILRIFAIFMAFQVVSFMLVIAATSPDNLGMTLAKVAGYALILVPCLGIAFGAEGIVDFLTPKAGETYPEGPVTSADIQAIGFSMLGAYLLYSALRETISVLFLLQAQAQNSYLAPPLDTMMHAVLGWIVGFYFLLGAPALRRWIVLLRRATPRVD